MRAVGLEVVIGPLNRKATLLRGQATVLLGRILW